MTPTVRYDLKHGDMLTMGDMMCQYLKGQDMEEVGINITSGNLTARNKVSRSVRKLRSIYHEDGNRKKRSSVSGVDGRKKRAHKSCYE